MPLAGEAGVEGTVVPVEIESSYMKRLSLIIAAFFLVIGAAVSRTDMTAELKRTTVDINTQAQTKDGRTRVLMAISSETGVPVTTLQTEQSANGLGYGDLLIANLVASESGKNVSEVVAIFKARALPLLTRARKAQRWVVDGALVSKNNEILGPRARAVAVRKPPRLKSATSIGLRSARRRVSGAAWLVACCP